MPTNKWVLTRIRDYIQETVNELLYKVSWPSWPELQNSAVIVFVASVIIALIVFFMDYIFGINSEDSYWRGFLGYFYSIFQ